MLNLINDYKLRFKNANESLNCYTENNINRARLVSKLYCYKSIITELEYIYNKRFFVATGNEFGLDINSITELMSKESALDIFRENLEEDVFLFEIDNGIIKKIRHEGNLLA